MPECPPWAWHGATCWGAGLIRTDEETAWSPHWTRPFPAPGGPQDLVQTPCPGTYIPEPPAPTDSSRWSPVILSHPGQSKQANAILPNSPAQRSPLTTQLSCLSIAHTWLRGFCSLWNPTVTRDVHVCLPDQAVTPAAQGTELPRTDSGVEKHQCFNDG